MEPPFLVFSFLDISSPHFRSFFLFSSSLPFSCTLASLDATFFFFFFCFSRDLFIYDVTVVRETSCCS